ncbi:RNA cytosine-C(5)-methyltransferase NSUN2-like isoform X2 [Mangifera indica]|uniref:RNA cytosine-C(5)-methyltransferase NSUN2-like isoform X2 n=1 Tax=Mangifera indica TaxID=29780 RepID=UPI001CFB6965|nr:RNA cytosine-C(5)-methyltransferase NSUN2-like isoform X2 [Mangifera indica]
MGGGGREGRSYRSRTQRKHFKQSRENVWKRSKSDPSAPDSTDNPTWQPFATQNPAFDEYYKAQGIVAAEEWDRFVEVLRKALPAAFRINSSSQFCSDIRSQLENDFMKSLQAEVSEDSEAGAIRPLPWYPDNLAWQSNFSRMQLRKNQTLERFHEFLKLENEIGNITRQEAVSMVPPLFLDVQPDHFILDMCAAPGSKTFQLLEIIHQSTKPGSLPDGMVVANDLDVQRCNLLIHQTKRMCTANLIVTNHEAQHFPGCRSKSNASNKGIELESNINQLLFDRVLCDVPCSGDGTLRKAPDIWRKWNVGLGNGLHSLQLQIAMRGISLLKVGGRMVYSTCSMNPVENEAVVSEILRKCGGSVELVDVSTELPQLIRRPGLRSWKIRDKGVWLASYKDVPKYRRTGILPSMFPSGRSDVDPTDNGHKHENGTNVNSEDALQPMDNAVASVDDLDAEVSDLPLEHCMRLVPHDQNSGAFFIAVLQKVSPLAVEEKPLSPEGNSVPKKDDEPHTTLLDHIPEDKNGKVEVADDTNEKCPEGGSTEANLIDTEEGGATLEVDSSNACEIHDTEETEMHFDKETDSGRIGAKRKLQVQGKWKGVDPVVFFKDETIISSIKTFYGINESFMLNDHLVTRNSDAKHVKRIYYVSNSVKDILELNFRVGQQLKITSVGLKMFERQTSREGTAAPCSFRISSEGLPVILPYITKQILCASATDFKHLLQYKTIKFPDFVDAEFGENASKLMMGCCVIVLRKGSNASTVPVQVNESTIAIGCWKGRGSLSVMVTAVDCQELLERLLVRIETQKDNSMPENNVEAAEAQDPDNNGTKEGTDSIGIAINA